MYLLRKFRLLLRNASAVLYSTAGAEIIEDPGMIALLKCLEPLSGGYIAAQNLKSLMLTSQVDFSDGTTYLSSQVNLLLPYDARPVSFQKVILVGDSEPVIDDMYHLLKLQINLPVVRLTPYQTWEEDNGLFVYISEHYNPKEIQSLYSDHYTFIGSAFITSYVLHDSFFIDNLFVPSKGLPCHFCGINRWMCAERAHGKGTRSWFHFYNYILNENIDSPFSLPLDKGDRGVMVFLLRNYIKYIVGYDYMKHDDGELSYLSQINLTSGETKKDISIHWQGCGCLTGSW